LPVAGDDRLEGLSPHQDRVPNSQLAEALQVSRNVPGQLVVFAYDAVFGRDRRDNDDLWFRH